MRRLLSGLLLACALALVAPAPADAAVVPAPPVFSGLSAATPGHLTGTVTSDQPTVWVRLASNVPSAQVTLVDGSGTFDLETWGYPGHDGTVTVQGVACPRGATRETECSPVAYSAPQTASEVTPTVTWFADDTIGPGQGDPVLTVADSGGGNLRATFASDGRGSSVQLAHNGTTTLPVSDGTGTVRITRCAVANDYNCSSWAFTEPLERPLQVYRRASAEWTGTSVATGAEPHPEVTVQTSRPSATDYSLTWFLAPERGPLTPVPGTGGSQSGTLTNGETGPVRLDTTGVPDGAYTVVADLTITDPAFGTYTGVRTYKYLNVDKTGPGATAVKATPATIYPLLNTPAYPSTTTIDVTGTLEYSNTLEIRDAKGKVVRRLELEFTNQSAAHVTWNGRDDRGEDVPAGTYTVVVLDYLGNAATTVGHVTVSSRHLVAKTFTYSVAAGTSTSTRTVGRCSTLATPSSHGWSGSLGYYSSSRCRPATKAEATVTTWHRQAVPAAAAYLDVQVTAYGGAATGFGGSTAVLAYDGPVAVAPRGLGAHLGFYAAPRVPAKQAMRTISGRPFVAWKVGTNAGRRYDVKAFTVSVRYLVWG